MPSIRSVVHPLAAVYLWSLLFSVHSQTHEKVEALPGHWRLNLGHNAQDSLFQGVYN